MPCSCIFMRLNDVAAMGSCRSSCRRGLSDYQCLLFVAFCMAQVNDAA